jgi:hypothetical protein
VSALDLPASADTLGPLMVSSLVLAAAGAAKLVRPNDTARALRVSGIRATPSFVRAGSVMEFAIASIALLTSAPVAAAALAASYALFAVFMAWALRTGAPIASCGCFGTPDTPPTRTHVVINGLLSVGAAWAAWARPPSLSQLLTDHTTAAITLLASSATAAALTIMTLTSLLVLQRTAHRTAVTILGREGVRRPRTGREQHDTGAPR